MLCKSSNTYIKTLIPKRLEIFFITCSFSCSFLIRLMSQGALPTLAPRPAHLAASHQSGISCQPLKITPPSGQEVTYNLDPRQIQTIMMNAATHDMTNTMQVLGTLQPTQPIQANPYLGIAAALEQATRRASQAGSTQQSPATSHGSLPTGSHLPNIRYVNF